MNNERSFKQCIKDLVEVELTPAHIWDKDIPQVLAVMSGCFGNGHGPIYVVANVRIFVRDFESAIERPCRWINSIDSARGLRVPDVVFLDFSRNRSPETLMILEELKIHQSNIWTIGQCH